MTNLESVARAFENHGFVVRCFDRAEDVAPAFAEQLQGVGSVGFGGSSTLRELGLDETARQADCEFYDHWEEGLSRDRTAELRRLQGRADFYVTSANAATVDGRLVLVDGMGNRVAASVFGPKEVIFVIGGNKIRETLDEALQRVKDVAAPRRAAQLDMETPCAKTGKCSDCNAKQRICRSTLIVERPSFGMRAHVWLVEGDYGL